MNHSAENEAILSSYTNQMEFLISVYGLQSELTLFRVDSSQKTGYVIATRNSNLKVGEELGPIGKKVLSGSNKGYNYLINVNHNGNESEDKRKLSYFLIRNSVKTVIGILFISFKTDHMLAMKKMFDQILGFEAINENPMELNDLYFELETEDFSITKYAQTIISNIIAENGTTAEEMSMEEKAEIVQTLDNMEVFYIKGSVKEAAAQLLISVPTVYRLLKR